ncbi:hypothetical protein SK128_015747 [Halocaridina rubra]|uniref:Sulfotransferase n=1 Tax=Halocaridina rubra TaxID=373956 RepID=A0AAN9AFP0_HALRR
MVFNKVLAVLLILMGLVTVYEITTYTGTVIHFNFKYDKFSFTDLLNLKFLETEEDNRPLSILLLSSLARSGSTMFSELLSTGNDSVLFFEPLWDQMNKPCFQNGSCVSNFISNIFNCSYENEFEDWLIHKTLFFHYYHPKAKTCASVKCQRHFDMRGLCQNATTRIVKVIRSRLSWVKELLSDPQLNVKIIYLTRDPRGSISSIENIGWDATPKIKCGDLLEDMEEFDALHKLFPYKIKSVSLEALSLYQIDIAKDIYLFLYGTSDLPQETRDFIELHMNAETDFGNNMDTRKNSSVEYQAWRLKILESTLAKIESETLCLRILEKMKHTVFGTIKNAQNLNISLFTNK